MDFAPGPTLADLAARRRCVAGRGPPHHRVRRQGSDLAPHRALAFFGPGYLVAVGYMDPGNWATSLAGGSKFGYTLLFVALLSNIMAIILQALCARLAIATGRDLAQACRDAFPRPVALAAVGAGRDRDLRHRPRRGDRHGDRAQPALRHSARARRPHHRARRVPDPLPAEARASAGSRPSSSRCSA